MKRTIATVVVAAGLLWVLPNSSSAQGSSTTLRIQATSVSDLRAWDTYITQRERSGDLRMRSEVRDPALPARTVERFDQYHNGVRIWGADIVRDSERGVPVSVFGVLAPDLTISVEPSLDVDAARPFLLRLLGADSTILAGPELVVLPLDTGEHRLAYTAVVSGAGQVIRAFVDAHTGAELLRYSDIQTQSAVGTGQGVLGDTKKLSVYQQSGVYLAFDSHRPPVLSTYDMRGNLARAKQVLNGAPLSNSELASDTDNVWTDPAVVDAHVHAGWTYDFYFKRFGRSGFDNNDRAIKIVANAVTQEGTLSISSEDRDDYALNAYWIPSLGVMYFGSGLSSTRYYFDGKTYNYFAGGLDIVAHEFTHGVTTSTSNLTYRNESGALNEAFSDMMGKSVEFFYHPAGSGVGKADYVIGKDVVRGYLAGTLNGSRSMANPSLYGDPDHYTKRLIGAADDGYIHSNSGIPNHAFYLAIEGGTNRTSGLSVQGVGAANREQIEKVFYRAFTLLMPASSTFATARAATIQAARDLYGTGGVVERAVTQAWAAIGVVPRTELTFSFSPSPAVATTQCQFGNSPCWIIRVTVNETGGGGFTVDRAVSLFYDDNQRFLGYSEPYSFANYNNCGPGSSRIDANGTACQNWEVSMDSGRSGYFAEEFSGRSDDGTPRTFRSGLLRLAPLP